MNINKAFPSKFLKASDFDDVDTPCTIKRVVMEQAGQGNEDPEKPVIYFREFEKGLICNKTNSNIITKLYGDETDQWIGQKVVLWVNHDVQFKGEMVSAIRVRSRAPASVSQPARQSEADSIAAETFKALHDPDPFFKGVAQKDPQTLAFVLTVEGLDADEHVYKLLEDFGYATLEVVPVTERDQFIVFVQTLAKRATAK